MVFGTSAGRAAFEAYKNKSPLPENIADENGHEKIAAYLRSMTERYLNSKLFQFAIIEMKKKRYAGMQHRALYFFVAPLTLTSLREMNSTDPFNFFIKAMLHEKVCKIDSRAINVGTIYATTIRNYIATWYNAVLR